jgi:outer membrane protein TolC
LSLPISWNIFDAGRVRQNIKVQSALQEQALAHYEATILFALEEVENALIAYAKEQTRLQSLTAAEQAAQQAFELAKTQYTAGLTDFQVVLDSQRSLLTVQDLHAISEAQVTADLIRLYKAVGGGWATLSGGDGQVQKKT